MYNFINDLLLKTQSQPNTYTRELLVELVNTQDTSLLSSIDNIHSVIPNSDELEDVLVAYYIKTPYITSSLEFTRHPYIDKLLAFRLIDILSFANKYMDALKSNLYCNCNADVIYLITIYSTDYNDDLFTMDMLNNYCASLNWKMIALSLIYKTRVFSDIMYDTTKYKLRITSLINSLITSLIDGYDGYDEYHRTMATSIIRLLMKELDALLDI
jgi:hypothetical protein